MIFIAKYPSKSLIKCYSFQLIFKLMIVSIKSLLSLQTSPILQFIPNLNLNGIHNFTYVKYHTYALHTYENGRVLHFSPLKKISSPKLITHQFWKTNMGIVASSALPLPLWLLLENGGSILLSLSEFPYFIIASPSDQEFILVLPYKSTF